MMKCPHVNGQPYIDTSCLLVMKPAELLANAAIYRTAYREAGQYRAAVATFEQASVRLSSLGRDDTELAGTMFNNWALALVQVGHPIDAEKIYRRAIDISSVDHSDQGVSPMLLINYASTLRELWRLDEAASYADVDIAGLSPALRDTYAGLSHLLVMPVSVGGEGIALLSVALTREQAAAFAIHATLLVEAGRPPCPLCSLPLAPAGHDCPRTNGPRPPVN